MRKVLREILRFGVAPIAVALVCGIGLVGGITDAEALVPVYLLGLIFAAAAIVMYAAAVLCRAVRWLVMTVR